MSPRLSTKQAADDQQRLEYAVLEGLHRKHLKKANWWSPHPSQALVAEAVFARGCKQVFVQCGRKWGKTEIIVYCLWRYALLNPNSSCYYICPEAKQAKEIVWKSKDRSGRLRIQGFGPSEFIDNIQNDELRITFKNGSFIKVDGSDNFDAWAGISPNFIVLDEFRSFKPEFYSVMNPNRATFDAPMLIIGTPPDRIWITPDIMHQYVEIARETQYEMATSPDESFWIKRPSWDNPDPLIHKFLRKEKKRLERRNKMDEWWREYGAEVVQGGANKVFPTFIADKTYPSTHVHAYGDMIHKLENFRSA